MTKKVTFTHDATGVAAKIESGEIRLEFDLGYIIEEAIGNHFLPQIEAIEFLQREFAVGLFEYLDELLFAAYGYSLKIQTLAIIKNKYSKNAEQTYLKSGTGLNDPQDGLLGDRWAIGAIEFVHRNTSKVYEAFISHLCTLLDIL